MKMYVRTYSNNITININNNNNIYQNVNNKYNNLIRVN